MVIITDIANASIILKLSLLFSFFICTLNAANSSSEISVLGKPVFFVLPEFLRESFWKID